MKSICEYLPSSVINLILSLTENQFSQLKEIRLRIGKPCVLHFTKDTKLGCIITKEDIDITLARISDNSLNSVKNQLCQGYITLSGGIRAGIAGEAVIKDGKVSFIHNINGICFRLPREIKGCGSAVAAQIAGEPQPMGTLIISPPGMGKTTLLRDICHILAQNTVVCVIDERDELAACAMGVPSFDMGCHCDIISRTPKHIAIPRAVRTLSPCIIVTDEIGGNEDMHALLDCVTSGVGFVASLHGSSLADAKARLPLLFEYDAVRLAVLIGRGGVGRIDEILKL